jgi:hypothetical protein
MKQKFVKSPVDKKQIESVIRQLPPEVAASSIASWMEGIQNIAEQQFNTAIELTKMESTLRMCKN